LGLPKNWRGITLGEVLYKVVATIMMSRLEVISAKLPHEGQVGFRPARGSRDGNFNVRQAYRKRHEHGLETWILFLDLVKAFDRVPRSFLWKVLERLGCPPKLLRLLKALHSDVTVEFTVQGVKMILESLIGVKQGDILGPILFVLFICGIMMSFRKKHPNSQACVFRTKQDFELRGRKFDHGGEGFLGPGECRNGVHAVKVDDSEYADDCAVMYPSDVELRYYTPLLFTHFSLFGIYQPLLSSSGTYMAPPPILAVLRYTPHGGVLSLLKTLLGTRCSRKNRGGWGSGHLRYMRNVADTALHALLWLVPPLRHRF